MESSSYIYPQTHLPVTSRKPCFSTVLYINKPLRNRGVCNKLRNVLSNSYEELSVSLSPPLSLSLDDSSESPAGVFSKSADCVLLSVLF